MLANPSLKEDSVKLLRIDNHVDEKTQTVRFYARLPNSVARTHHDQNRAFDQWRFRPGQRLHLRLPVERWQDQWTLPAEAVVIDGPNVMVFAAADEDMHGHATHNETAMGLAAAAVVHGDNDKLHDDHDHDHDVFIEFEPVPVRLLYRDDQTVVIATDGQITQHTEIALNNAQKLYLAMKMQAGGGGGPHDVRGTRRQQREAEQHTGGDVPNADHAAE